MSFKDYIGKGKLFEGAFVINLPERVDRKCNMDYQLAKVGITDSVEWLPAIKHRYGMVGCSLSHLECVKLAKQRGWKTVLIFEDDVIFTKHFETSYERSFAQLQTKDWAVYHLGAMLMNICRQVESNLLQIGYNWAAHAVAIHERAYDFIINNYDHSYSETDSSKPWGGHYPFDGFINKEVFDAKFNIFSAYPLLATQFPSMSDTWGEHRDYKYLIEESYEKQIVRENVVCIFSKDRPMQLHALLKSFFKYNKDRDAVKISVLYKASPGFCDGYIKLVEMYGNKVNFVAEFDFFDDVKRIVRNYRYTTFLVDDTIFHRPFKLADGNVVLSDDPEVYSFSYRLGSNTTYSYINNIAFKTPEEYSKPGTEVKVDWTKQLGYIDFGYPFEVSSSMYRTIDLYSMFGQSEHGWNHPNHFELVGTNIVRQYQKLLFGKYIATYKKSVAVSVPLNRVQDKHLNRVGTDVAYDAKALNEQFTNGFELDFDNINENWTSNSVHIELRPTFKYRS